MQERKFRNDKVDNLCGVDPQHAFAEIKLERVRRFVIGDLQNSFVDREDDDLARPVRFVTELADKDFFGVERPNECDVDVTAAFEIFRNADVLDAAGAACLEPSLGVDAVALDGDQAVTGVRRGDADRDFVAAVVMGAIELYLKLGILLQWSRNGAASDDAKLQLG